MIGDIRIFINMDLQENINRIKGMMGLIVEEVITEQSKNIDWLIDWFNKVPENKLSKTFTALDKNGKEKSLSRLEIQLLLTDKSKVIVVTDPKEIKVLDDRIAFFLKNWDPSYSDVFPGFEKYVGKVVINGDWQKLLKGDPQNVNVSKIEDLKHHEQIHLLQHQQNKDGDWNSGGSKIISNHCKGNPAPQCDDGFGYLRNPEEIYAHLFSMRELLGIQPIDTVTDASVVFQGKNAVINVTVNRNGKIVKLPPKTVDKGYSPFNTIYCCNKSFKESLTYLHNTLAGIKNTNQTDTNKLA
jgi:hypothetical protein